MVDAALLSAALWSAGAWLMTVAAARVRRPTPPGSAASTDAARAWLYAPLWVPALVLGATLLTKVVAESLGLGDHCRAHGGHHHHVCLLHPPHASHEPLVRWLLGAAGLATAIVVARAALAWLRQQRLSGALVALSRPSTLGDDVRVVDRPEPVALTVGLRRPTVVVSDGLLAGATPETLHAIVAHERAHVRRRDTRWAFADALAAALLPAWARRTLVGELVLAREQACDREAARATGPDGAMRVAMALTEVARLRLAVAAGDVAAASGSLEARIAYLLGGAKPPQPRLFTPTRVALALAALGAGPLHGVVERAVSFILH